VLPYLHQRFEIEIDASHYDLGPVLKQSGHPIAFHSKTFSKDKQSYTAYDSELYALVQTIKYQHHYVLGN
jgi:hypothetical protein